MAQRMFVAIRPPADVVADLADFLEPRTGLTWIDAAQWHLTLAFFAAVPEHRVEDLAGRLADAARGVDPFELTLTGAGAFPDPSRARVLWLGVRTPSGAGEGPLARLAGRARNAGNVVGAPADGRAFVPHLTLARPRRPIEATRWLRVLETFTSRTWRVEEITLIASHLGEGPKRRPRHEVVAEVAVAGPGA